MNRLRLEIRRIISERNISDESAARLDRINDKTSVVSQRAYDFIIGQCEKFGLSLKDKKRLQYDVSDAISKQIEIDIDE